MIKKSLLDIIKKPYYYVPPCPSCNSPITGRFMKYHRTTETDWMITESLKNGELVRPVPEILEDNAFCLTCGYTWPCKISLKMLSINDIKKEKGKRMTTEIYKQKIEQDNERELNAKVSRRGLKKAAHHIKRYIGKI